MMLESSTIVSAVSPARLRDRIERAMHEIEALIFNLMGIVGCDRCLADAVGAGVYA